MKTKDKPIGQTVSAQDQQTDSKKVMDKDARKESSRKQ